jgi:CheY-like chemotaxis protein
MPKEKRNRYLNVMLETAERATSLTSQLLAFARRQPLEPEVIDLSVRLDAMGEMLQRTLGSLYDLELDLAPGLWLVEIDPTGLEAALLNAVLNARDAMPNGGRITIATRNVARREGDGITLSISDTGHGIPPETLRRVFEPFFTTKPTGKGTGLGLSQIHGYAVQSGGSAKIESEVGKGTTVELWIPRTSKERQREVAQQGDTMLAQGLKVLIVEDSDHVRYFARQLLDDLGCEVIEASNGSEALELLKAHEVDLVFSDIVMPGMSGLELAQAIKKTYDKPVLLASGYSSKQFIPKDEREFAILRKPYKLETLAAGINHLLGAGPDKR